MYDQRGVQRPVAADCDIGAIEASPPMHLSCVPFAPADLQGFFTTKFDSAQNAYVLSMTPKIDFKKTLFSQQMQAYTNYASALDPSITSVTISVALLDVCATEIAPPPPDVNIPGQCGAMGMAGPATLTWTPGAWKPGGPNPSAAYAPMGGFFKFPNPNDPTDKTKALSKGRWNAVWAEAYFNGDSDLKPRNCPDPVQYWHREG